MAMPAQKPGHSRQDYQTPPEFLAAVRRLLDITQFDVDLAATAENAVCPRYYTERDDAFKQSWLTWRQEGWNWLNPPFADLEPWVRRAWEQAQLGARVAMLVPAAVGANWWRDWVDLKAQVRFLNGRLTFVGETAPYPKDCCLLLYALELPATYEVWNWRKQP